MIVVDSSIWIGVLRGRESLSDRLARAGADVNSVLVGDIVMLEVLQGARTTRDAARIERGLREFVVASMLDERIAVQAARNYRDLRERGITVRKTTDMIIGTFCIEHGHLLLHDDRDFVPMATYLGLQLL